MMSVKAAWSIPRRLRPASCSLWQATQLFEPAMSAWNAVGCRWTRTVSFAWQATQVASSTPFTGVWHAAQSSLRNACALDRGPGEAMFCHVAARCICGRYVHSATADTGARTASRSEEHTSELQSLMRISYAVFCLKKKKKH